MQRRVGLKSVGKCCAMRKSDKQLFKPGTVLQTRGDDDKHIAVFLTTTKVWFITFDNVCDYSFTDSLVSTWTNVWEVLCDGLE